MKLWNEEAVDQLRGCFECTDWTVFDDQNIHDTTITVTEYIKFCVDTIIPERSLRLFPNSKPCVSEKLKSLVYEKKAAFLSGDQDLVKEKQLEIKKEVKRCKKEHGKKLEDKFEEGNSKAAAVMQSITGHKGKNKCGTIRNGKKLV
ncbi:hypothetical protein HOLleu_25852 [Holothuria leucospilota]|uniref:Uncharacterized protein n=1 Tax=Holothuria leucospilota TaxID=206669 RepID=A0A9Q1BTL6_HOLLE|nr:hypothetical protein HOLleu_25852 [Holothuria leucospilota]